MFGHGHNPCADTDCALRQSAAVATLASASQRFGVERNLTVVSCCTQTLAPYSTMGAAEETRGTAMREQDASGTDFYVIRYEALLQGQQGYGKRKPLASVVAMPHGEDCPPNAVAGPFFTRHEAERVRYEQRDECIGR